MTNSIYILAFAVALASAQLNFEGNPLTENTEYTAEESQSLSRSSRQELSKAEGPQRLYPIGETSANERGNEEVARRSYRLENSTTESGDTSADATPRQLETGVNPVGIALSSFLNSKTPEESRLSLDHYLRSQYQQVTNAGNDGQRASEQQMQPGQRQAGQQRQSTVQTSPQILQYRNLQAIRNIQDQHTATLSQALPTPNSQVVRNVDIQHPHALPQPFGRVQIVPDALPQQYLQTPFHQQRRNSISSPQRQHSQDFAAQAYDQAGQPNQSVSAGNVLQQTSPALPAYPLQARADFVPPAGWRQQNHRTRGYPPPWAAQSRIGAGYFQGPVHGPPKHKGPVEVIYTKPPGFHTVPPISSNPPAPYEDASVWFPDADYPPPAKDIYYSQLYAQSYDPHYYNYIAKTGKIKPWLYGKFDKHRHQDESIWTELFSGFKRHGLKNMMSPGFLLGMTIPTVFALMLTAFVQKRSFARSDSGGFSQDNVFEEYLERIVNAIECYEMKNNVRGNETIKNC